MRIPQSMHILVIWARWTTADGLRRPDWWSLSRDWPPQISTLSPPCRQLSSFSITSVCRLQESLPATECTQNLLQASFIAVFPSPGRLLDVLKIPPEPNLSNPQRLRLLEMPVYCSPCGNSGRSRRYLCWCGQPIHPSVIYLFVCWHLNFCPLWR